MRWTEKEEEMLRSKLSDEELCRRLGRTKRAIIEKRWRMGIQRDDNVWLPPYMSQLEKEARIYKLAKKYGVKIR